MRGGQDVLILTIPLDLGCSLWSEVRGLFRSTLQGAPRTIECTQSYKHGQTGVLVAWRVASPSTGLLVRRMSQLHSQPSIPVLTTWLGSVVCQLISVMARL